MPKKPWFPGERGRSGFESSTPRVVDKSSMVFLELLGPDGQTVRFRLGERPVFIGRDPSNDIVLTDDTVSNRHASAWIQGNDVWLEDLRSTNGTTVNGGKATEPMKVKVGDVIEVGRKGKRFQVGNESESPPTPSADRPPFPVVEDVRVGIRKAIQTDRFRIAGDPGADLVVAAQPDEAATIMVHPTGEIWLGRGDTCEELKDGEEFSVGQHRFRIAFGASGREATRHVRMTEPRYVVRATLDGPTGPEATIADETSGRTHSVRAENRATLLYVLAQKFTEDVAGGIPAELAGWCTDDDVVVGVWGRTAVDNPTNSLHVLLNRLRNELKLAGLDPWCVEKRRGHVRVRARSVVVS